jgi:OmpA-OmpF porin, OOP family
MSRNMMKRYMSRTGLLIQFAVLLSGCGPTQQDLMAKDQLAQARAAYEAAKNSPNVEVYAPIPLLEAGKAMSLADQAKDAAAIAHLSYLAEKRSLIAMTIAEGKVADNEAQLFDKERTELLLMKREWEAKVANQELEKVRLEAAIKDRELEVVKREAEARASEADAKAREAEKLMRELSDLKAKQTERGIVLTIGDVLFATGKADITSAAKRSMDKLAEFLTAQPSRNVVIEGYTDNVGGDKFNLDLSEKRAESAKTELTVRGIRPERITTRGLGKNSPVASNATAEGRQLNRRVEVIILNEGVKVDK